MIVQASNPKLREVGAEGMGQGMDTRGMGVGWGVDSAGHAQQVYVRG